MMGEYDAGYENCIDSMVRQMEDMQSRIDSLHRENAKLRELVRDMMRFFEDGDYCTVCEVERECTANEQYNDDCLMRDVFRDRMRELGVDDG